MIKTAISRSYRERNVSEKKTEPTEHARNIVDVKWRYVPVYAMLKLDSDSAAAHTKVI